MRPLVLLRGCHVEQLASVDDVTPQRAASVNLSIEASDPQDGLGNVQQAHVRHVEAHRCGEAHAEVLVGGEANQTGRDRLWLQDVRGGLQLIREEQPTVPHHHAGLVHMNRTLQPFARLPKNSHLRCNMSGKLSTSVRKVRNSYYLRAVEVTDL